MNLRIWLVLVMCCYCYIVIFVIVYLLQTVDILLVMSLLLVTELCEQMYTRLIYILDLIA